MLTLALALVTTLSGAAQEASLVGQAAPELTTKEFLGSDGRTRVADYKGQVLLVEKFATWCGPCIAQMPHLAKLAEEFGKDGFHVLSISDEPKDVVLQFLTQLNVTEITYTMGVGGGAAAYPAPGIPKAFLIDVDGKVVWEGHPGQLTNGMIEAEVKKVKLTPELRAAAAERALAYAEALLTEKEVLRAVAVLERAAKEHKGTPAAAKANARADEIEKDPALAAELDAQRALDKLVGGLDLPAEKLKPKDREAKADKLVALAKKLQADAPTTAQMAEQWARVLREDWGSER
jgi:thiol-disulfide isomerase/thioredoxin